MNIRAIGPALFLLTLSSACASDSTERRILDSWKGVPVEQVFRQWGLPAAQAKLSDGSTMYEWRHGQNLVFPGSTTGTVNVIGSTAHIHMQTIPPTSFQGECTRSLIADPGGMILEGRSFGNNCCVMAIAGYCASLLNPDAKGAQGNNR